MKTNQRVYIFDTTLRDGQQSPGAGMSFKDNLIYAEYADALRIDILEAGFPAASRYDFDIVHNISKNMAARKSSMIIAALCQLREEQVIQTMEALQPSLAEGKARMHIYLPVDPNLMQASLGKLADNYNQIISEVYQLIKLSKEAEFEVEFSLEGYSRMQHNFDFTTDIIRAAVNAGARVINCPDTIGGASIWENKDYFVNNMKRHAEIISREFPQQDVIWSAHCHNDLGLALQNTLNAVFSGPARQIEGCMNGVGERAGNLALEQFIMAIDQFGHQAHDEFVFSSNINLEKLTQVSNFIAEKMLIRQPHWPITGENAARHSAGGHTNAILKNPLAYQPFDPKQVGQEINFIFGPLSGSNHAQDILVKNGFHCENNEKTIIAQAIKNKFSKRRKGITDQELISAYQEYRAPIKAIEFIYAKDEKGIVSLQLIGEFFTEKDIKIYISGKNSALAALDHAVKKFLPSIEIIDYRSNACAGNTVNAECNSTIVISACLKSHRLGQAAHYIGKAIDADIHISAIKAYIDAVNQAYIHQHYKLEAKNIIEKIWDAHIIIQKIGHPAVLAIDKMLLHEVTSAQAFDELRNRHLKVKHPERMLATLDHAIPTDKNRHVITDKSAKTQVETLRKNAIEFGIQLYDFNSQHQGIVHVIGPELGFTLPGSTLVCGDSHTSTHGAFGALAFGIGTSEVAHVLATSAILQYPLKTMKVEFKGKLPPHVTAKDIIMKLIATIGIGGATEHIIEYTGEAIRALSMEARMTICNMSIECGARAGLIAPDEVTFDYLKGKPFAAKDEAWEKSVNEWRKLASDPNCKYDKVVEIDIHNLTPMVTWGINPEQAIGIDDCVPELTNAEQVYNYTKLQPGQAIKNQPIDWAFIGSCTNGRIEDLRLAASVLKNKKIASHVTMFVVPGSEQVRKQAISEGLDKIFEAAGAQFRMPGCSMCIAMNPDKVPSGARCISTSNRNFMGRQGPGSITHLASPATVAASAIKGAIISAGEI